MRLRTRWRTRTPVGLARSLLAGGIGWISSALGPAVGVRLVMRAGVGFTVVVGSILRRFFSFLGPFVSRTLLIGLALARTLASLSRLHRFEVLVVLDKLMYVLYVTLSVGGDELTVPVRYTFLDDAKKRLLRQFGGCCTVSGRKERQVVI